MRPLAGKEGGSKCRRRGRRTTSEVHYGILDSLPYDQIEEMTHQLLQAYHQGRTVFSFGNGGSARWHRTLHVTSGRGR